MNFPKLLTKAIFKNSTLYFHERDLENDEDLVEYMDFKTKHKFKTITLASLKKLHSRGQFVKEIHRLFVQNKRLAYLEEKRRFKG
jgi:SAM-dependent methyltransferase